MKFNDGFWRLKHGVKAYYGLQVVQVKAIDTGYDLQVATRPIQSRGDTLGGPLLSVRVHSPTQGVIGVKIDHIVSEQPKTNIRLFPDDGPVPDVALSKDDKTHVVKTGDLTAEITENPYTVTFRSPKQVLTEAGYKYQALYEVPSKWTVLSASQSSSLTTDPLSNPNPTPLPPIIHYINAELKTSPGELIYGLGEQFGPFVKNGQAVKIWNQDGGTSSDQAYKCVPFYITNRGYGVFINHPGEVEVEVSSEKTSTELDLWSLVVNFLLNQLFDRDRIKLPAGHARACSFTFDPDNFPDPKAYLAEIKEKYGVKICLWINPYISQLSPIFKEGVEGGYFIKRTNGTIWQWDLWQPGLAVVDVTNPDARKWYTDKLSALIDLGVDAFKTDFGERIPHANVVFHDGSEPIRFHNTYSVVYNELVFDLLKERFGEGEAVVFARSATVGGQRFPVHWGGDCESTWEAMAEAMRGALSLTLSGFGYASHDIGGFEGLPPPEIYQRWVAFGLFSSHSRLHGSSSYRVPWIYGEDAAKSMSKFLEAKHRLMPYIYNLSIEANSKGHPLMRAMFLEFLDDRTTHYLDRQFMLGPNLLVAPVFVPLNEETEYYLPAGRWTSFFHPERTIDGPKWVWDVDRGDGSGERRLKLGVSWAGDHRVVEGAELAAFVECWRTYVEAPQRLIGEAVISLATSDSWRDVDLGQSSYVGGSHNLDPAVVDSPQFGLRWKVDFNKGETHYARPLIYTPPSTNKQIAFLASTENRLRVLDAETGEVLNERQLAEPFPLAEAFCTQVSETLGIMGTPTIDPETDTAYFYAKSYIPYYRDVTRTGIINGVYYFYAVDVKTLEDKEGFPILIDGLRADNDPRRYFIGGTILQRPSLLQLGNIVYAGFGGLCDAFNATGTIIGVDVKQKKVVTHWVTQAGPDAPFSEDWTAWHGGGPGGVWQSGQGLATDGSSIFFVSDNGGGSTDEIIDTTPRRGNASLSILSEVVARVNPTTDGGLEVADFFRPHNYQYDDEKDLVLQTIPVGGEVFGSIGSYPLDGGYIYVAPLRNPLSAYKLSITDDGTPQFVFAGQSEVSTRQNRGTGIPTVTSFHDEPGTGIVWLTDPDAGLDAWYAVPREDGVLKKINLPTVNASILTSNHMPFFRGLDSAPASETSSVASLEAPLYTARLALTRLASTSKHKAVTAKLGLVQSGRIALDIVEVTRRANIRRKDCISIAEEAYQLVNAVDGGVKGRAIDVNNVLRDYVARLNRDLDEVRNILRRFTSYWAFFRFRSASRDLGRCHDILSNAMEVYLLLLKCSLAQHERRDCLRQKYESMVGQRSPIDHHHHSHQHPRSKAAVVPPPKPPGKPFKTASRPPRQARSSGSVAF
ncbi:hypothetical protein NLJ89_g1674 [Agrocybe chaxingu]|uniref:Glycoside hydrolase family 31 N-terminal domain-containing protein n=1 Tax=Agrocybe chaxingu TaxID=84603 RepID=A0A9W8MZL4_9AGAR|nr:hypothetical protein NLJ89_g1674 [Agrocybe chaxingu]